MEEVYNDLTLVRHAGKNKSGSRMAIFKCTCGSEVRLIYSNVKRGQKKRCTPCAIKARGISKRTHNKRSHPLFGVWSSMKGRCFCPTQTRYRHYGGRGITVCQEWISFQGFYDWCVNNGWEKGLTIERINANGNYEPSNCTFITRSEQAYNKEKTIYVVVDNKKVALSRLIRHNNLSESQRVEVYHGIKNGASIDEYVLKYNLVVPEKYVICSLH